MKKFQSKIIHLIILTFVFTTYNFAQENFTSQQKEIVDAINGLSKTTSPKGNGATAYGKFLADDFSRWTIGSDKISKKKEWLEGIRSWFDEGWRVSDRKQQNLEINIRDGYAFAHRIVIESYQGPKGDTSNSKAALAEIWVKIDNQWKLLTVTMHPLLTIL